MEKEVFEAETSEEKLLALMILSEREEQDLCSIYSTLEEFDGKGRLVSNATYDEDLSNLAMIMVKDNAQAIATNHDSEIEKSCR